MHTRNQSRGVALSLYFGAVTAALGAPGELDPTFGTNGLVRIDVEHAGDAAAAVFAEADGKLLVGRTNTTSNSDDLSVVRLDAGGALDASFASGGRTVLDVAHFGSRTHSVLSQSDGKVLAGGLITPTSFGSGGNWSEPLAVARFLTDGRIDTSFGDAGIASVNFETGSDYATASARTLLQQGDGKIVAAGTAAYMGPWDYSGDYYWPDMVLARLDAAGNLDTSFGNNGRVHLEPSPWRESELHWLTQQPDGRLVGAGSVGADMAVVRLTADGARDQTFGDGGVVTIRLEPDAARASADAVAVQPDGKIVIGGTLRFLCDLDDPACAEVVDAVLVRLNPEGSLDASFGTGGVVTFDALGARTVIAPGGLVVEPAGTIVAGGDSGFVARGDHGFVDDVRYGFIARFTASGALDTSFGSAGITLIDVGRDATPSYARMRGIARTPAGAIVAALSAFSQSWVDPSIVVARLAPSGGGAGTIGLVRADVTVDQGSSAAFIVRRAGGATGAVSVDYATFVDPTSNPLMRTYAQVAGTLTWPDGDTSDREVGVFVGQSYGPETSALRLDLSNPAGGAVLAGTTGRARITAVNDNAGTLQFELVDVTVAEGDIRTELRVTRTGGSTGVVSVRFGSYGVTAIEGWDYGSLEGTLRWENGDSSAKSIRVNITMDGEDPEASERFRVVLSDATGGAELGAARVAEVTIENLPVPVPVPVTGGGASRGGGGAGSVVDVLMLGLALLASLLSARARIGAGTAHATNPA